MLEKSERHGFAKNMKCVWTIYRRVCIVLLLSLEGFLKTFVANTVFDSELSYAG